MLEVIITVHDQQIVVDFEMSGKYRRIPKYTYAFVGNGECKKIRSFSNVVIVRELQNNIEQYKNLVDFTAWYAFAKNNLIQSKFVSLLQYDTAISPIFYEKTLKLLKDSPMSILGYQRWPLLDENFIENNVGAQPLIDALHASYEVDLMQLLQNYLDSVGDVGWPSSNNMAMASTTLEKYVQWFSPMIEKLGPNVYSGHSFERSIKIFCILNNIINQYAPELAHHYQLNSHGTQHLNVDFAREIARVAGNELPNNSLTFMVKKKIRQFIKKCT